MPGKVNINTAFDREPFDAVIDAREKPDLQTIPATGLPRVPQTGNFFFENPANVSSGKNTPLVGTVSRRLAQIRPTD